jgi:hypothetical protein
MTAMRQAWQGHGREIGWLSLFRKPGYGGEILLPSGNHEGIGIP